LLLKANGILYSLFNLPKFLFETKSQALNAMQS